MTDINKLINVILNEFIPKTKINKFSNLLVEHGIDPNEFSVFIKEKEPYINIQKIPIEELKERLFMNDSIDDKEIKLDIENITNQNEILNKCDEIFKKINNDDIKNKSMYYYLGRHLKNLKILYKLQGYSVEEFYDLICERYRKKSSTIYKYIKFFNLCNEYEILLKCNLGFDEIMKNIPEIISLL